MEKETPIPFEFDPQEKEDDNPSYGSRESKEKYQENLSKQRKADAKKEEPSTKRLELEDDARYQAIKKKYPPKKLDATR